MRPGHLPIWLALAICRFELASLFRGRAFFVDPDCPSRPTEFAVSHDGRYKQMRKLARIHLPPRNKIYTINGYVRILLAINSWLFNARFRS